MQQHFIRLANLHSEMSEIYRQVSLEADKLDFTAILVRELQALIPNQVVKADIVTSQTSTSVSDKEPVAEKPAAKKRTIIKKTPIEEVESTLLSKEETAAQIQQLDKVLAGATLGDEPTETKIYNHVDISQKITALVGTATNDNEKRDITSKVVKILKDHKVKNVNDVDSLSAGRIMADLDSLELQLSL